MRTPTLIVALSALLTGCGSAADVSFSSVGGGSSDLSLAPMPAAAPAPDPEAGLTDGIFFMQTPDDIELQASAITAGPEIAIESQWDAPLTVTGGIAPKGKADVGPLQVGNSSVKDGTVSVMGGGALLEANRDPSAIQAVLRRNAGQVSYCHNIAKSRYSDVAGRVEIAWTIRGGQVEGATVQSNTTGDDRMAACVLGKVMRMSFPEDMTVASYSHPFVFQKG